MTDATIYHNPACSKSRGALALLREAGVEPTVVEYLKTPPSEAVIRELLRKLGIAPRDLLRKGDLYKELDLGSPAKSDDEIVAAMAAHPALIERPVVVTAKGAKVCRPPELVRDLI